MPDVDALTDRLLESRYGLPAYTIGAQRSPLHNRAAGKLRQLAGTSDPRGLLRDYVVDLRNRGVPNGAIDEVLGEGRAVELLSRYRRDQGWDRRRTAVRPAPRPTLIEEELRALR